MNFERELMFFQLKERMTCKLRMCGGGGIRTRIFKWSVGIEDLQALRVNDE